MANKYVVAAGGIGGTGKGGPWSQGDEVKKEYFAPEDWERQIAEGHVVLANDDGSVPVPALRAAILPTGETDNPATVSKAADGTTTITADDKDITPKANK